MVGWRITCVTASRNAGATTSLMVTVAGGRGSAAGADCASAARRTRAAAVRSRVDGMGHLGRVRLGNYRAPREADVKESVARSGCPCPVGPGPRILPRVSGFPEAAMRKRRVLVGLVVVVAAAGGFAAYNWTALNARYAGHRFGTAATPE